MATGFHVRVTPKMRAAGKRAGKKAAGRHFKAGARKTSRKSSSR